MSEVNQLLVQSWTRSNKQEASCEEGWNTFGTRLTDGRMLLPSSSIYHKTRGMITVFGDLWIIFFLIADFPMVRFIHSLYCRMKMRTRSMPVVSDTTPLVPRFDELTTICPSHMRTLWWWYKESVVEHGTIL